MLTTLQLSFEVRVSGIVGGVEHSGRFLGRMLAHSLNVGASCISTFKREYACQLYRCSIGKARNHQEYIYIVCTLTGMLFFNCSL